MIETVPNTDDVKKKALLWSLSIHYQEKIPIIV